MWPQDDEKRASRDSAKKVFDARDEAALFVVPRKVAVEAVSQSFSLAICRCPLCDKYLSDFRPRKELSPSCRVKVREPEEDNRWQAITPD
jgi:hypothetical protein